MIKLNIYNVITPLNPSNKEALLVANKALLNVSSNCVGKGCALCRTVYLDNTPCLCYNNNIQITSLGEECPPPFKYTHYINSMKGENKCP